MSINTFLLLLSALPFLGWSLLVSHVYFTHIPRQAAPFCLSFCLAFVGSVPFLASAALPSFVNPFTSAPPAPLPHLCVRVRIFALLSLLCAAGVVRL